MRPIDCIWLILAAHLVAPVAHAVAQQTVPKSSPGSLIEDRAASKLLEAGRARYEANEPAKAVEIWQSVIERYPRSRHRFAAHIALGNNYLDRDRAYDRGRVHFELASSEENTDQQQRAEAMMRSGICYFHLRNFGKCFQTMRDVIEQFPGSVVVNDAWYYIGLGHFQLGHYGRAIDALENVGTAITSEKASVGKLEAGKRLFVRIEDADLAILGPQQSINVLCEVSSGDRETVACYPVSRHARLAIGSAPTQLGTPKIGNGRIEIKGDDTIRISYTDKHTSEKKERMVASAVEIVGTADARITDGAFQESLLGAVLGKQLNLQIQDGDRDLSDSADEVSAAVIVYRSKPGNGLETDGSQSPTTEDAGLDDPDHSTPLVEIDRRQLVLTEVHLPATGKNEQVTSDTGDATPPQNDTATSTVDSPRTDSARANGNSGQPDIDDPVAVTSTAGNEPKNPSPSNDASSKTSQQIAVHSGLFRTSIPLKKTDQVIKDDDTLQAIPGDLIKLVYLDQRHQGVGAREVTAQVRCLEGNIGGVRISHAKISDQELKIQTELKTASALTNIGNRYKEFGLKENAEAKYSQALDVCEQIMSDAAQLGGSVLEQTYVQLWRIYFEMERLDLAAAMCQRLQRQFPASGFVDEALLQLAEVARKQNDLPRAIQTYSSLLTVRTSELRGEAQFGIAQCYEQLANETEKSNAAGLRARAFEAYKRVLDQYPDSGRVGDAVAKMAEFYYEQKDYGRAVEVFENVLLNYPDAKFLDVILFNYGRCLYRLGQKPQALAKFEQLLAESPDSPLATNTKKIIEAMRTAGK